MRMPLAFVSALPAEATSVRAQGNPAVKTLVERYSTVLFPDFAAK